ncbi:MAG: fasciclin domain-containing protein [Balneolaceae bacterium]|nr:fasciclin domain-containing protein [Balneolaceae bacterium]
MKTIANNLKAFTILLVLSTGVFFAACDNNGTDPIISQNIVEFAQQSDNFTTLAQLVEDAGLASELSGPGPFTVFGPTDAAFAQIPSSVLENLTNDQLVQILTYHVVQGEIFAGDLSAQQSPASLEGGQLFIEAGDGVIVNDNSNVVEADVNVSNGVIHGVDQVLFPDNFLDVVSIVGKRFNLEVMESAVSDANLVSTLQQETQDGFTVFAPTNVAFDAITVPNDQQQLQDVLTYHVIPSKVLSGDLQASQTVTTVNGNDITIEVSNGTVTINGSATVITADLEGTNGVVHIIDEVLIPPSN